MVLFFWGVKSLYESSHLVWRGKDCQTTTKNHTIHSQAFSSSRGAVTFKDNTTTPMFSRFEISYSIWETAFKFMITDKKGDEFAGGHLVWGKT